MPDPRPTTSRGPRLLAVLLLGGLLAVGGASVAGTPQPPAHPHRPRATAYDLRIVEHNISGVQHNLGADTALDAVDRRIASHPVDAVMLNEVCQSQYAHFAAEHRGWAVRWHPTGYKSPIAVAGRPGCLGSDDRIGELVATPWPITGEVFYCLARESSPAYPGQPGPCALSPSHDKPAPVLSCYLIHVSHHAPDGLEVCTTHLPALYDTKTHADHRRDAWTTRMRADLHRAATTLHRVVVLGGDFNSSPPRASLDQLYRTTRWGRDRGPGDFFEADETDRRHFGRAGKYVRCARHAPVPRCRSGQSGSTKPGEKGKLDYIFFSRRATDLASLRGQMIYPRDRSGRLSSEHRVYIGTATVRLRVRRR